MRKWTFETAYLEALKYSTFREFQFKNQACYWTCWKNGWNAQFTWLERKQKDWTEELIFQEALKYNNVSSFRAHSRGAYNAAVKFNILSQLVYLQTTNINLNALNWLIYIYELNNYVYVGLTNNIKRRDYEHYHYKRDSLNKWCSKIILY